jgi:adenosylhomocysteinase
MNVTIDTMQYQVKDISLADFGRKEIEIAEKEMPGYWRSERNTILNNH